jgi:HAD superfamily hydrolase (TIGR01509 family)
MAPDAIVFDFDGLILDTELSEYTTVHEVFAEHGVDLPLAEWQEIVGTADHRHWLVWLEDELGVPFDEAVRIDLRARRLARHHAFIATQAVLPGVVALLDQADELGIPAAVASSSTEEWVGGHLQRLGLRHRFSGLRCREHVARTKPAPDLYVAALELLGDPAPPRVVAFEDSRNGCTAAKAAGLHCVVAPNDVTRGQDLAHADLVVASLAEVDLRSIL